VGLAEHTTPMMMMIAPNSRARKGGKEGGGGCRGSMKEFPGRRRGISYRGILIIKQFLPIKRIKN